MTNFILIFYCFGFKACKILFRSFSSRTPLDTFTLNFFFCQRVERFCSSCLTYITAFGLRSVPVNGVSIVSSKERRRERIRSRTTRQGTSKHKQSLPEKKLGKEKGIRVYGIGIVLRLVGGPLHSFGRGTADALCYSLSARRYTLLASYRLLTHADKPLAALA
ncbi:hypothetical protein BHE74_00018545 [Ensete ventricosum]|nr:hypothetical protein GW17_00058772 [Ensete ventricosum]RWW73575.1 hypothetical protein BHE74_00018545 [Ensete ventricosum]